MAVQLFLKYGAFFWTWYFHALRIKPKDTAYPLRNYISIIPTELLANIRTH